jgi:hypothetical protein
MKSEITINHPLSWMQQERSNSIKKRHFRKCGFFNLPALMPAGSDDPDAP